MRVRERSNEREKRGCAVKETEIGGNGRKTMCERDSQKLKCQRREWRKIQIY